MTDVRLASTSTSLDGLVEALDRLIDGGAAVVGDVVIGVGGVDLIRLDVRALLAAVVDEPRAGELTTEQTGTDRR